MKRKKIMETFTPPRAIINNKHFKQNRKEALLTLNIKDIDEPLIDAVKQFNELSYCFTLQCCYGHFLYGLQQDPNNLCMLPNDDPGPITYRIAYIAFCVEDNLEGVIFCKALQNMQDIDKDYIQFGSADWFWERQVNSFVLQVEPTGFKYEDRALVNWKEAIHIEKTRQILFREMNHLLKDENYK
jgi:hypothetical protein